MEPPSSVASSVTSEASQRNKISTTANTSKTERNQKNLMVCTTCYRVMMHHGDMVLYGILFYSSKCNTIRINHMDVSDSWV